MTRLGYQIPNFTYPAGTNIFDSVVAQAKAAEDAGFDRVLVMDHFYQLPGIGAHTEPISARVCFGNGQYISQPNVAS